jgi:hypothetical protein
MTRTALSVSFNSADNSLTVFVLPHQVDDAPPRAVEKAFVQLSSLCVMQV